MEYIKFKCICAEPVLWMRWFFRITSVLVKKLNSYQHRYVVFWRHLIPFIELLLIPISIASAMCRVLPSVCAQPASAAVWTLFVWSLPMSTLAVFWSLQSWLSNCYHDSLGIYLEVDSSHLLTRYMDGTPTSEVTAVTMSASDLTMHDTSCLNPIMTWIIWFWYITKPKFASEIPKREEANHTL